MYFSIEVFSIPNFSVRAVRIPGPRRLINKNAMLHLISITHGIQTNGCGEIELQEFPPGSAESRTGLILLSLLQPDLPSSMSSVFGSPIAVAWSGLSLNSWG